MTIRNLFHEMKQHKNYTIREIVERTGLGYATVAHLCSPQGQYDSFTIETLDRMCDCFKVAPDQLIEHSWRPRTDRQERKVTEHTEVEHEIVELSYDERCSALYAFTCDCCQLRPDLHVRKTVFWEAYQHWCADDPVRKQTLPRRSLAHVLEEFSRIGEKRNGQGQWVWTGIALLPQVQEEAEVRLECAQMAKEYMAEKLSE